MTTSATEAKKIFEPNNLQELLRGWLQHSYKGRQRHDRAARRLDRERLWLGASAAGLAALVGTSVFAALEKEAPLYWKVLLAMIGILSAVLSGLSTFLNLPERAEKHRTAGVRYKAMIRELERIISGEVNPALITAAAVTELQKRLDDLEENAPIVPERIYVLVDKDWNSHGVEVITKANDFYQPGIQA